MHVWANRAIPVSRVIRFSFIRVASWPGLPSCVKQPSAATFTEAASPARPMSPEVSLYLKTVTAALYPYKDTLLGVIIVAMTLLAVYILFQALPLRRWISGFIGSVANKVRGIAWSFATSHVGRASLISATVSSALSFVIMWLPAWMVPMSIIGMVAVQTCIELLINPSIGMVVLKSAATISVVQWVVLSFWPYMSNVIYLILGSACIHGFIHDRALLHRQNQQQKLGQKAPDLKAGQRQSEPHKPGQNQNAPKSGDPQQGSSKVEPNHVEVRIRKGFPN